MFKRIREDIDAFMVRDPAARSRFEVALCYQGFHALLLYRLSHVIWKAEWRLLARFISSIARWLTMIEIHPGAQIGDRFVIDHGAGVVIGETSIIGNDVTIYQGVTLGGVSPSIDSHSQVDQKRHPTLGNDVIIGSGAQILGPILVGDCARVGANAVVHMDIPAGVTAVGIPARVVMPKDKTKAKEFVAYGEPVDGSPDPVLRTIEELRQQVTTLMNRVEDLQNAQHRGKDDAAETAEETPAAGKKKAVVASAGHS